METYALHLCLPRCCGRVVKYRELNIVEMDEVSFAANASVDKDAPAQRYQAAATRLGIQTMIVAISVETFEAGADIAALDAAGNITWEPMTVDRLTMDASWRYEKLFRAKDETLLHTAYNHLHGVSAAEAAELVGKSMSSNSKKSTSSRLAKPSDGAASPTSAGTAASASTSS